MIDLDAFDARVREIVAQQMQKFLAQISGASDYVDLPGQLPPDCKSPRAFRDACASIPTAWKRGRRTGCPKADYHRHREQRAAEARARRNPKPPTRGARSNVVALADRILARTTRATKST